MKTKFFPDSSHPVQLEQDQGPIQLDNFFPYHGAHEGSTYDILDKNWSPHIRINNPSNCKADPTNSG